MRPAMLPVRWLSTATASRLRSYTAAMPHEFIGCIPTPLSYVWLDNL